MRARDWVGRDPAPLLIRFCLAAGVLFLLRDELSQVYLATMVPAVNGWLRATDVAALFQREGHGLRLSYPGLGLQFTVHDIIYQNLMVAAALFAATPGPWRWRLKWLGIAVAALWVTHVASLYLAGHVIVWDFVESLPAGERGALARRVAGQVPGERDWLYSHLFGLWHTWGRPTLGLGIWLFAARQYLRLPGDLARETGEVRA
ncbi:MAG: hypothetical protein ABIL09_07230 [Gemmatimonadota bacterium]